MLDRQTERGREEGKRGRINILGKSLSIFVNEDATPGERDGRGEMSVSLVPFMPSVVPTAHLTNRILVSKDNSFYHLVPKYKTNSYVCSKAGVSKLFLSRARE